MKRLNLLVLLFGLFFISCDEDKPEVQKLAPLAFDLVQPADKAQNQDTAVVFTWNPAKDPANGKVSYTLVLAKNKELTEEQKYEVADTTYKLSVKLATTYFWRVIAQGKDKVPTESKIFSFTTKKGANLSSPLQAAKFLLPAHNSKELAYEGADKVSLQWNYDAANKKFVANTATTYDLYLSENKEFQPADVLGKDIAFRASPLAGHEYKFPADKKLKSGTKYYWKLVSKLGAQKRDTVMSFTTKYAVNDLKATNLHPANDATDIEYLGGNGNGFQWNFNPQTAKYEGPLEAKYTLYLSEDNVFEDSERLVDQVTYSAGNESTPASGYFFKLPADKPMKPNTKYYWKLKTELGSLSTDTVLSFTTRAAPAANQPPSAPRVQVKTQTLVGDKVNVELEWVAATDPEGDAVTYEIYGGTSFTLKKTHKVKDNHTATTFTWAGLDQDKTYRVVVLAKDANTQLDLDNAATFRVNKLEFKTTKKQVANSEGTVDLNGITYKTVVIDGKTWLAENYRFIAQYDKDKHFVQGYTGTDVSELELHNSYQQYGVLYTGDAVNEQGFAPPGWHVATDDDWKAIEKYSGMTDDEVGNTGYRGTTAHKFMSTTGGWASGANASNALKFNAKTGGYSKTNFSGRTFPGVGDYVYYWTGTKGPLNPFTKQHGANYNRYISGTKTGVGRGTTKALTSAMYVRLVKD